MAVAAAAGVAAWISLVGPATEAITQVVSLFNTNPTSDSLSASNLNDGPVPANNIVNIGVGFYEGGSNTDTFGGDGINVDAFTSVQTHIGTGKSGPMNQEQVYGTYINPDTNGPGDVQAWQLTLAASGANDVCIQFVELVYNGVVTSGFDGTWGQKCGQDWYWSTSTWGNTPDGKPYTPACFWVDNTSKGKTTKDHPTTEMWVNMQKLLTGEAVQGSNTSVETYCNPDIMKFSSASVAPITPAVAPGLNRDSIGAGPAGAPPPPADAPAPATPGRKERRGRLPRRHLHSSAGRSHSSHNSSTRSKTTSPGAATGSLKSWNSTLSQLVVSELESHSANKLCNHPRSRGPDFISKVENMFCDMTEKITYPLCSETVTKHCFALDQPAKKVHKRGEDRSGQKDLLHRQYGRVQHWGK